MAAIIFINGVPLPEDEFPHIYAAVHFMSEDRLESFSSFIVEHDKEIDEEFERIAKSYVIGDALNALRRQLNARSN